MSSNNGNTAPESPVSHPHQVRLSQLVAANKGIIVVTSLLLCVYQAAEAMVAVLLGWLVSTVIVSNNVWVLAGGVGALGLVLATVSVSWQTAFRLLQNASARQICAMRTKIASRTISPTQRLATGQRLADDELPTVVGEDVVQTSDIIEIIPVGISSLVGVVFCTAVLTIIDLSLIHI